MYPVYEICSAPQSPQDGPEQPHEDAKIQVTGRWGLQGFSEIGV